IRARLAPGRLEAARDRVREVDQTQLRVAWSGESGEQLLDAPERVQRNARAAPPQGRHIPPPAASEEPGRRSKVIDRQPQLIERAAPPIIYHEDLLLVCPAARRSR